MFYNMNGQGRMRVLVCDPITRAKFTPNGVRIMKTQVLPSILQTLRALRKNKIE